MDAVIDGINPQQQRQTWMLGLTGLLLWMIGLFWVDAFEVKAEKIDAIVVSAPACLAFMDCQAEVEYEDQHTHKRIRAWIPIPETMMLNEYDIVQIRHTDTTTELLERKAKPPAWIGTIAIIIGSIFLIMFIGMIYMVYIENKNEM
jgi:hypothetical protein